MPGIIHRRVRGIINSQERRKPHGDPKRKNSTYRCHFARILHIRMRGINSGLEWRQSCGVPNKFSDTGVTLPQFSHIGVAGITPERKKDGKS